MSNETEFERAARILGPSVDAAVDAERVLAPCPGDASDSQINRLWEGGPVLPTRIPESALKRPEINLTRRAYDIEVERVEWAPPAERYRAIDFNTYDGASEGGISACMGLGATPRAARMNLLEQMAEYDDKEPEPAPRPGRVVHSSPFEPPTVVTDRQADPDEEP